MRCSIGGTVDFAPAQIERLLVRKAAQPADALAYPNDLVWECLQRQRTLAPTLFSAWARAHVAALDPMLRHLLTVEERRRDVYAALLEEVRTVVPSLVTGKGAEIAALYPPGILRWAADLDLMAGSEEELWRIAGALVQRGWMPRGLTIATAAGDTVLALQFHRPPADRYAPPCGVDLTTHPFFGDLGDASIRRFPAPCLADPHVKNLALLLEERFQQPFRARDLLDAAVLLEALGPRGRPGMFTALDELGYWPEYAELLGELRGSGLLSVDAWRPPDLRARVRRQTAIRAVRAMGVAIRPLAAALHRSQKALLLGRAPGRVRARWWRFVMRRARVETGIRGGALAFGLPVEVAATDAAALRLVHRRHWSWAITPIGVFLLSLGSEIPEEALEDMPVTARLDTAGRPG